MWAARRWRWNESHRFFAFDSVDKNGKYPLINHISHVNPLVTSILRLMCYTLAVEVGETKMVIGSKYNKHREFSMVLDWCYVDIQAGPLALVHLAVSPGLILKS